jgi:lipopolysaccharide transport system ATP-binding protein
MALAMRIEGLGKRYEIGQQREQGAEYVTLRDALTVRARELLRPQQLLKRAKPQDFWALKDVNLTVEQGDKVAIIGHNGAGKSTLLKILSQITEPTTGRVELYGRVSSLLEVGTGFHPELTGRENIYLNGSVLGMTQAEVRRKFDEIVDFAGIEDFLDTPVKRYSSGMRMRLGFAVAAHLESEILIIDEVLAVGDAAFQKKCLGKMDEVSKAEGRTILFVSHNISTVQQLCNKGMVLQKGEVVFNGHVNQAVQCYEKLTSILGSDFTLVAKHKAVDMVDYALCGDVASEADWEFSVTFEAKQEFKDCFFDFGIYNERHYPLVHHMSPPVEQFFTLKKGRTKVRVRIPAPRLNLGSYQLIIYLADREHKVLYESKNIPVAFVMDVPPQTGPTALITPNTSVKVSHEKA